MYIKGLFVLFLYFYFYSFLSPSMVIADKLLLSIYSSILSLALFVVT
jgi:hypothetical protein